MVKVLPIKRLGRYVNESDHARMGDYDIDGMWRIETIEEE